ncbi:DUF1552 domain-containing protein [Lignipirellula cremea]|uniref:DUF1552 domain-containing protein n=1 Tax=Lignipirellula cremea TaxID=2528010 RepID=A0A518DW06_9BACT|nr:DUF1552 domain-containing protein [Lignipirellula cremea]QDU96018.1 hypothetical protein Pla8534_38370 [Lignipirellula cremea]
MINRRQWLTRLAAGGALISPFAQALAAQAAAAVDPPAAKRFLFVLFENGLREYEVQPHGVPLATDQLRIRSLEALKLPPFVIDPFTPFKDRMTILQGLRGSHLNPNHGAGYGALSGLPQAPADKRRVRAESIDAALARVSPGLFPAVVLGINGGDNDTSTAYGISAWDKGKPIPIQCRPELAYESLFGSTGAGPNDFLARKNLLDFVSDDLKHLQAGLGSAGRQQLEFHVDALESLSKRWGELGDLKDEGALARFAPQPFDTPPRLMPDVIAAQFDIAAAALSAGLTNVATISSGLGGLAPNYKGFSNMGQHGAGHGNPDPELGVRGHEIVRRVHRFMAERTAALMKRLDSIPEGDGSMLDNTLVVFMSDSAERQHSHGSQWPVVLMGDLGGKLKTGQLVSYPMEAREVESYGETLEAGTGQPTNPTLNRLYCTLLHAAGAPRDNFNLPVAGLDSDGPLEELLV